jgi:hypothetical protein
MIRGLSAFTHIIDNPAAAAAEILEQLDLDHRLLRYSVGIWYYYGGFAGAGALKELREKLPFPVLGGTTSNSAVPGSLESQVSTLDPLNDITLTLTVFTSDDCAFTAGVSGSLGDDPRLPVENLYRRLLESRPKGMGETPAMIFIMAPRLLNLLGDDYLAVLDAQSGGVPVFGSAAFTHTADFKNVKVYFDGLEYEDSLGLIAFWGNLKPAFFISPVPGDRAFNQRAKITSSYKNRVREINGIPALRYLESIGLARDGNILGSDSFPMTLRLEDGSQLVRTMLEAEGEEVLCSGAVPVQALAGFSFCDKEFIISSARKVALDRESRVAEDSGGGADLVISCAARRWTLGADVYAEIKAVNGIFKRRPYHMAYSSGEFCPVPYRGGLKNYFHNYSICVCAL